MITMIEVQSTALKAWGYDPASQVLAIRFKPGQVTHYKGVPQDVADAFEAAESKGRAVGQMLRGVYETEAVLDETEPTP